MATRFQRSPVKAEAAKPKTAGELAAEKSTAQAESAVLAEKAGRGLPDGVENLTVVEHKRTTFEPSAHPWQFLSEARIRACDPATLRAIAGMRGYGESRGHKGIAKLSRTELYALIIEGQKSDSRLHDPNAREEVRHPVVVPADAPDTTGQSAP